MLRKQKSEMHDYDDDGVESFDEWLRYKTTQEVQTEINVQLGAFTLRKCSMLPLPAELAHMRDFTRVFGSAAAEFGMQCAVVEKTSHRQHLRLVGRRHDVQLWDPDPRPDAPRGLFHGLGHGRDYPSGLGKGEAWVREVLGAVLRGLGGDGLPLLPSGKAVSLRMQKDDASDDNVFLLCGRLLPPRSREELQAGAPSEPLREIRVTRDPPTVSVFDVVEVGRRWYRSMAFSSNAAGSLHTGALHSTPAVLHGEPRPVSSPPTQRSPLAHCTVVSPPARPGPH